MLDSVVAKHQRKVRHDGRDSQRRLLLPQQPGQVRRCPRRAIRHLALDICETSASTMPTESAWFVWPRYIGERRMGRGLTGSWPVGVVNRQQQYHESCWSGAAKKMHRPPSRDLSHPIGGTSIVSGVTRWAWPAQRPCRGRQHDAVAAQRRLRKVDECDSVAWARRAGDAASRVRMVVVVVVVVRVWSSGVRASG